MADSVEEKMYRLMAKIGRDLHEKGCDDVPELLSDLNLLRDCIQPPTELDEFVEMFTLHIVEEFEDRVCEINQAVQRARKDQYHVWTCDHNGRCLCGPGADRIEQIEDVERDLKICDRKVNELRPGDLIPCWDRRLYKVTKIKAVNKDSDGPVMATLIDPAGVKYTIPLITGKSDRVIICPADWHGPTDPFKITEWINMGTRARIPCEDS